MNRLQKKCMIVSGGLHLSLLLILVVGPAFVSSKSQVDDSPILTFVALRTTDEQASGGGNPKAQLPAAQPQVTRPDPVAPQPDPPQPTREPTPPSRDNTPSVEPATHKVVPSLKPIVRNPNATPNKSQPTRSNTTADPSRQASRDIDRALNGIRGGLSSSTAVEMPGPGGGGVPYANFLQAVKSVYANAWQVPEGITDDSAIATVSVTIAHDGTVLGSRITDPSGNALVDQSVQATLDRVKFAVPLPEDAKEAQRTVTIRFNVKAKLLG